MSSRYNIIIIIIIISGSTCSTGGVHSQTWSTSGVGLGMCLRGPGGSKGPTVTHGGLRACGGPGPHGGPPYVTPILRAGTSGVGLGSKGIYIYFPPRDMVVYAESL
jgi:hypothetical protein